MEITGVDLVSFVIEVGSSKHTSISLRIVLWVVVRQPSFAHVLVQAGGGVEVLHSGKIDLLLTEKTLVLVHAYRW